MSLAALPTLLLAAVIDSPALYQAFVLHEMDYTTALTRYLIAVLVAGVMLSVIKGLSSGYLKRNEAETAAREAQAAAEAAAEAANPARRRSDGATPA